MPAFRVEFHNHCDCDPQDSLDYSARDLIDACVAHGVHALAITPHRIVFEDSDALAYARSRGILLIPGVEKMIEGREWVLLNVTPDEIPARMTREDLQSLRKKKGGALLVLAPHPFYPRSSCLGPVLDENAASVDVVEWCHLYLPFYNPNEKAARWAKKHGKPLLATSDAHALALFGRNSAVVEAPRLDAASLFQAIREGRVENCHRPYGWRDFGTFLLHGVVKHEWMKWRRHPKISPPS